MSDTLQFVVVLRKKVCYADEQQTESVSDTRGKTRLLHLFLRPRRSFTENGVLAQYAYFLAVHTAGQGADSRTVACGGTSKALRSKLDLASPLQNTPRFSVPNDDSGAIYSVEQLSRSGVALLKRQQPELNLAKSCYRMGRLRPHSRPASVLTGQQLKLKENEECYEE
jgi:hypothetical protein